MKAFCIKKIKPYCSDKDYQLITDWLKTGDETLRDAAYSAVYFAACSADVALHSVHSANQAAYSDACLAVRNDLNQILLEMIKAERPD